MFLITIMNLALKTVQIRRTFSDLNKCEQELHKLEMLGPQLSLQQESLRSTLGAERKDFINQLNRDVFSVSRNDGWSISKPTFYERKSRPYVSFQLSKSHPVKKLSPPEYIVTVNVRLGRNFSITLQPAVPWPKENGLGAELAYVLETSQLYAEELDLSDPRKSLISILRGYERKPFPELYRAARLDT